MASALDTARASVQQAIFDAWNEATPLTFENEDFQPPDDAAWVRVDLIWAAGGRLTMDLALTIGIIQATIFVPVGGGTGELTRLADDMRDILSDATFGAVKTDTASGPRPGVIEQKWTSRIVDVSFEVEEAA